MTPKELLRDGAKELGIDLSSQQQGALLLYMAELKKWNQKINLTAITDEQEVVIKHLLDSLTYLLFVPQSREIALIDIGSGAGFPAIPMAMSHPGGLSAVMVESSKKKTSFLRHIIRLLQLKNIVVLDTRIENIPQSYCEKHDIVTARAFADMKTVISVGLPLLKPDGIFIMSRGPEERIDDITLSAFGVELVKRTEITLPKSDYRRVIWVLNKKLQK